ncbi:hypothetical protein ACWGMA_21145 [Streptomyces asiaticus]
MAQFLLFIGEGEPHIDLAISLASTPTKHLLRSKLLPLESRCKDVEMSSAVAIGAAWCAVMREVLTPSHGGR